jgi:DNA polymerase (family 10)/putative hydrolase
VKNGLQLLVFSEHVRRQLTYDYNSLLRDIEDARRRFPLTILSGCETKVLDLNGSLDVTEYVLEKSDIVIMSFHSFPYGDKSSYLIALIRALQHPRVDIWAHPTLFLKRHGLSLTEEEIRQVTTVCREFNVLVERNLRYNVPDDHFVNLTRDAIYVENSDAHSVDELRKLSGDSI